MHHTCHLNYCCSAYKSLMHKPECSKKESSPLRAIITIIAFLHCGHR